MKVKSSVFLLDSSTVAREYKGRSVSCNIFAINLLGGIVLIDSGYPSFAKEIMDELRSIDEKPLSCIMITHSDLDHVGNAYELQRMSGCKVYISEEELAYTTSKKPRFGSKQKTFEESGIKMPELTVYPEIGITGFRIIPTPGHTAGHVSILYEDILFPGDICSFRDGVFQGPNPAYTEDMELANSELKKLSKYEFKLVCPAHGTPFERKEYL